MSCSIQQAVQLATVFKENSLAGTDHHFKRDHIKQLSPQDRKVCFRALKQLEKAKLSDWDKCDPKKKLDDQRITDITECVKRTPKSNNNKKTHWYSAPFIGVAKLVSSFVLWFKNIFFGRVSTNKLYSKVAAYRQDWFNAEARYDEIQKGSRGKPAILKEDQDAIDAAQADHNAIENRLRTDLQAKRRVLSEIYVQNLDEDELREDTYAKSRSLKEIVIEVLTERKPQIGDYFKDLKDVAGSDEAKDSEVIEEHNKAHRKVTSEIADLVKKELHTAIGNLDSLHSKWKKHKDEAELLKRKFAIDAA
ncbi:MAG: hypothetical protein ACE5HI_08580 [bacterium]